jgi:hypothetical protein
MMWVFLEVKNHARPALKAAGKVGATPAERQAHLATKA